MRMALVVAIVLPTAAASAAQQPDSAATGGRTLLLLVDSLHVGFADTPRARALLKRVVAATVRAGDRVIVVSTSPNAVARPPSFDSAGIDASINQFVGTALRPAELLAATQSLEGRTQLRQYANAA